MAAVTVLGAGLWGTTVAWMLGERGHDVLLYSRDEAKRAQLRKSRKLKGSRGARLGPTVQLADSLEAALVPRILFACVAPAHFRSAMRSLAPYSRPDHRLIHTVKAFEPGGRFISEVVQQESNILRVGALVGPVVPAEIWKGRDAAAVIASPYQHLVDEASELLASPNLRIYGSNDLLGVELGSAMRTPVALAAGILHGTGRGGALLSVLLTRAIAEGARLAASLGGERATISGLSGIGDWMVTAMDVRDPVVKAGMRLATGEAHGYDEAAARVRTVAALAASLGVDMPITSTMVKILDGLPIAAAMAELMSRKSRAEID